MTFNVGDRVMNRIGTLGRVIEVDDFMVRVQFDNGRMPGWFDRIDHTGRLILVS
jgi:hypothetical protein